MIFSITISANIRKIVSWKRLKGRNRQEETMQPETARQCMDHIGISADDMKLITSLLKDHRNAEAKQRLRRIRCEMMDELHACQRKVDQLDWLIRETEKQEQD